MNDEPAFTRAMQEHPDDNALRLIFADWLEERGDPRGELIRLLHTLTQSVDVEGRKKIEDRLRNLTAAGVKPVGPFFTNSLGMKFAWVPAGTFLMGSPETEEGRDNDETQHKVTLTKGFFLAIHPVTQACWRKVLGNNPSHHHGDHLPVEQVSWEDCQEFLRRVCDRDGHSHRLPTEAEWEFACRAGTTSPFFFGETISTDEGNSHCNLSYGSKKEGVDRETTTPIFSFPPNALGLHDMHGNVWEWCADWYEDYPCCDVVDLQGPQSGHSRVLRGGVFGSVSFMRSASRFRFEPSTRDFIAGFRAAMTFTP